MRKPLWSLLMLAGTLLCVWGMLAWHPSDKGVEAPFATVERADVHQVLAIEGRLGYAEQRYIRATNSGVVTQVCVQKGQRVAAGEALFRLDGAPQAQLASAHAVDMLPEQAVEGLADIKHSVIRSEENCTVREVLVTQDMLITAGMPVAVASSNQQEIVCRVAEKDGEGMIAGMWGWLSSGGEALGTALVETVGECQADAMTGIPCMDITFRPAQHIELPEGAVIDVDVYIAGSDDVPSLPLEAITERDTVWWVSGGRCTEIPARIVMADEIRAWVELPEGINVALGEFVEGQRVREAAE